MNKIGIRNLSKQKLIHTINSCNGLLLDKKKIAIVDRVTLKMATLLYKKEDLMNLLNDTRNLIFRKYQTNSYINNSLSWKNISGITPKSYKKLFQKFNS